jgi:hypothetical protein
MSTERKIKYYYKSKLDSSSGMMVGVKLLLHLAKFQQAVF